MAESAHPPIAIGGLRTGDDRRTHIERINDWAGSPSAVFPAPSPAKDIDMTPDQFDELLVSQRQMVGLLGQLVDMLTPLAGLAREAAEERSAVHLEAEPDPAAEVREAPPAEAAPDPVAAEDLGVSQAVDPGASAPPAAAGEPPAPPAPPAG